MSDEGAGDGSARLLRWLADRELLRDLPQRYARAIDTRDHEILATLFHPDGVVDGMRGSAAVPAYLAGLRTAEPAFATSMHVLGDPLIALEPGADTATMDTYAVVHQLERRDGGGDVVLGMRYLDDVERVGEAWVIRHRRAEVRWQRASPPP